jgi:biotin synthase
LTKKSATTGRATKFTASIIASHLILQVQLAHRAFHKPDEIQFCRLLSIKTGGCPEDCAYCPQSAHYKTGVAREELMSLVTVRDPAKHAKNEGATRFCMGAPWRSEC